MADWYDGTINNVYPLACYHQAIAHLPSDIAIYSSAKDDIPRALAAAIKHEKKIPKEHTALPSVSAVGPLAISSVQIKDGGKAPTQAKGLSKAINKITPGNPNSFPLPLLILGALAILLIAAGGIGMLVRRFQDGDGPGATA